MKLKKTAKSNLENKKSLFFEIGLTVALGLALIAFEWASPDISENKVSYLGTDIFDVDMIETPRTYIKPKLQPPPRPIHKIKIIDDEEDIEDENIDWGNVDIDEGYQVVIPDLGDEQPEGGDPIIYIADKMPQYHGGDLTNFRNHIQSIVEYPEEAIRMQLEGKVFVQFVVNEKGYIVDIQIMKSPDRMLDKAVLAAINKTDRWMPGEQAGRKVKIGMSMPINFRLSY